MLVGVCYGFQVFRGNLRLCRIGFLRNSLRENVRLRLQINNEVGRGNRGCKHVEITLVKLELLIVEIEVGENFVAFEEKIADHGSRGILGLNLREAAMALVEKVHLSAEGCAASLVIKISEERIVLAIEDSAGVKLLGQYFRKSGFADAYGAFDYYVARRFEVWAGGAHARNYSRAYKLSRGWDTDQDWETSVLLQATRILRLP